MSLRPEMSTGEAARVLGASTPTVRRLLEMGVLRGRKVPRGSRFSWMVEGATVQQYLDQHGSFRRSSGGRATVASLQAEIAALRSEIQRLGQSGHTGSDVADLRAEAVTLRAALDQQRLVADLQRAADAARAEVVQHLLQALSAGEVADQRRREAAEALDGIVSHLATPGHAGDLG